MHEAKHTSLWKASAPDRQYPQLKEHLEVDVAIVGGGITGLTAALLLKRAGKRVAVLEAHQLGAGTTGHTTAHLTTMWDEDYPKIIESQGVETASKVARTMADAIDQVERLVQDYQISCSFQRIPGYYYAPTEDGRKTVQNTYEACKRLGLDVSLCEHAPLPFKTDLALEVQNQAQFHPMQYLHGLAAAVDGDGSFVFENSRVNDMSDGSPCRLSTPAGKMTAGKMVLATHIPLGISPLHTEVAPYRSYVIAFKPKGEAPHGLFWDTTSPYTYIRSQSVEGESLVMVGGKDRKTAHGSDTQSFDQLRDYVFSRFQVEEIRYEWSAQFYVPADRLPYIGKAPMLSNTFVGTGYSGDGITFGTAAGMIISELIRGVHSPYADLYHPSRIRLQGLRRFFGENVDVAKSFVKDRMTLPAPDRIENLKRGEGCVVSTGLSQLAVYRDGHGELLKFSAICPHLKCIVHWNDAEKTFDCPCHGSRFDGEGKILEGPALSDLTPWREED